MNIRGLDHLNLTVASVGESIDWYRRVFRFEVVERGVTEDGRLWAIIRSGSGEGSTMLCLYESSGRNFLDRHELAARGIHGISHFGLRIASEEEWKETMRSEGLSGSIFWEYPHSKSWYVNDPTGYEIEVAYWKEGVVQFNPMKAAV